MTYKERNQIEDLELKILQSINVRELRTANQRLAKFLASNKSVLESISPANLVNLSLRGYEIPDSKTRLESNNLILKLDGLIENSQREQYWLMLAQQREVILERIELDLEALLDSKMDKEKTEKSKQVLSEIHKIIRNRTDEVVKGLFQADIAQPELPLEA